MTAPNEPAKSEIESGITIFDRNDPGSIFNMVPEGLQQAMLTINPTWMRWKESTLENKCDPQPRDYRIRVAFWNEYNYAKDMGKQVSLARVVNGNCSWDYWYNVVLKSPKKLAWILYPPGDYLIFMEEMLHLGLKRMREILKTPAITRKMGKNEIDHKLMDKQMKAFALIDNRVKGAIIQKMQIEQKAMHVHAKVEDKATVPQSMDQIEEEIKRLTKVVPTVSEELRMRDKKVAIEPVKTYVAKDKKPSE